MILSLLYIYRDRRSLEGRNSEDCQVYFSAWPLVFFFIRHTTYAQTRHNITHNIQHTAAHIFSSRYPTSVSPFSSPFSIIAGLCLQLRYIQEVSSLPLVWPLRLSKHQIKHALFTSTIFGSKTPLNTRAHTHTHKHGLALALRDGLASDSTFDFQTLTLTLVWLAFSWNRAAMLARQAYCMYEWSFGCFVCTIFAWNGWMDEWMAGWPNGHDDKGEMGKAMKNRNCFVVRQRDRYMPWSQALHCLI